MKKSFVLRWDLKTKVSKIQKSIITFLQFQNTYIQELGLGKKFESVKLKF